MLLYLLAFEPSAAQGQVTVTLELSSDFYVSHILALSKLRVSTMPCRNL